MLYLGQLEDAQRRGVKQAAKGKKKTPYQQLQLFDHKAKPDSEWVEVDTANVRVENQLDFGGPWLALELIRKLQLDKLFEGPMPRGGEDIPWAKMRAGEVSQDIYRVYVVLCEEPVSSSKLEPATGAIGDTIYNPDVLQPVGDAVMRCLGTRRPYDMRFPAVAASPPMHRGLRHRDPCVALLSVKDGVSVRMAVSAQMAPWLR